MPFIFSRRGPSFIRFYYDESAKPFRELQQKIELGQAPFDNPPINEKEDFEPPFLEEWSDANTAVEILGLSCISMLSDFLKLYFNTLGNSVIGFCLGEQEKATATKHGFVAAFKAALSQILDTDWADCPVRFDVIEQVVLARNRAQHGGDLTSFHVSHDENGLSRHPRPFFASELEIEAWDQRGGDTNSLFFRH